MEVEPLLKREEVFYFIVTGYRKTFILMSNIKITYKGTKTSFSGEKSLVCECCPFNEIRISITDEKTKKESWIYLDETTAVILSKELRKEIAILKQNKGGING